VSKIKVDIISGFLGSGKTTLINKMLSSVYSGMKIAIVENEFGQTSIDSELFSDNIEITELYNGCACCTLKMDLIDGIEKMVALNRFDRIIIEPSGVAKLSDMKYIFKEGILSDKIECGVCITIINPKAHKMYSENFGAFYNDQIENADTIYISRADKIGQEENENLKNDIEQLNDCDIIEDIGQDMLKENSGCGGNCGCNHDDENHVCGCGGKTDDEQGCDHHDHGDANDDFVSYELEYGMFEDVREIEDTIDRIVEHSKGQVMRIKGFLSADKISYLVQWVDGQLELEKSDTVMDKVVVIEEKAL